MMYAKSSKSELREKLADIGEEKLSALNLNKFVSDRQRDRQCDTLSTQWSQNYASASHKHE